MSDGEIHSRFVLSVTGAWVRWERLLAYLRVVLGESKGKKWKGREG